MNFANDKELFQFVRDNPRNAESMRTQVAQNMAIYGCYFEGLQWLSQFSSVSRTGISRLPVDYRPDAPKLRVTDNRVTMLTQKSIAATNPEQIVLQVEPPELDTSAEAIHNARVHETAINAMVQGVNYRDAAQRANHCRGVFGVWGMVTHIEQTPSGAYLCVNDFDPSCLALEPSCQKLNLHEHPYVHYIDTWTLDRIYRCFGVRLSPEESKTVEQLEPLKIEMCGLSNYKLFTRYMSQSKSKAARVHQIHLRGDEYRFDKWFVVIEGGKGSEDLQHVNADNTDTPFGGMGLPMMLLHGHRRSDTMWSWGEPAQLKEAQDAKNLLATQKARIEQRYAGPDRWVADERAFGSGTKEEIDKRFSNQVGGVVTYKGSEKGRNVAPPQLVPAPPPPQFLAESLAMYDIQMRDKIHKAGGNFGETPTHVPFKTTERVLDEADDVGTLRIIGDVAAHEYLIGVMHGTQIKLLQQQNPPTARMLTKAGFQEMDFTTLVTADPTDPGCTITVEQSSIRARSKSSRKQDLFASAQAGMITPDQFQAGMADLEMPLSSADKQMADVIRRTVLEIIYGVGAGEQWQGRVMGKWGPMLIDALIRAQFDPRVKSDPAATLRVVGALESQHQMLYQEQVMADPKLAQALMQGQAQAAPGDEQATEESGPMSMADQLDSLTAAGSASR